jgi:hypothetical protein
VPHRNSAKRRGALPARGLHGRARMKRLIASFALMGAFASPAFATDVINQDQKAYHITIVDGSYTSTKDVSSRGSLYGVCGTGPCTFKIKGSSISAGKDDRIIINGGQFKKN